MKQKKKKGKQEKQGLQLMLLKNGLQNQKNQKNNKQKNITIKDVHMVRKDIVLNNFQKRQGFQEVELKDIQDILLHMVIYYMEIFLQKILKKVITLQHMISIAKQLVEVSMLYGVNIKYLKNFQVNLIKTLKHILVKNQQKENLVKLKVPCNQFQQIMQKNGNHG